MPKDLIVKVRRSDPENGTPSRFETYKVEREARMNVLDVLGKIQSTLDPSLAFRHSCRAGMCGTCAMRVNGRNRWTCRTSVDDLRNDILIIEPLPHYPVIRDLVVDMHPFFDDQGKIIPRFIPENPVSLITPFHFIGENASRFQSVPVLVEYNGLTGPASRFRKGPIPFLRRIQLVL